MKMPENKRKTLDEIASYWVNDAFANVGRSSFQTHRQCAIEYSKLIIDQNSELIKKSQELREINKKLKSATDSMADIIQTSRSYLLGSKAIDKYILIDRMISILSEHKQL